VAFTSYTGLYNSAGSNEGYLPYFEIKFSILPQGTTEFSNPNNTTFANFYNVPDPGAASFFKQMFMKPNRVLEDIGGSIQFANGVTTFETTT
jgi:hypothetical protein